MICKSQFLGRKSDRMHLFCHYLSPCLPFQLQGTGGCKAPNFWHQVALQLVWRDFAHRNTFGSAPAWEAPGQYSAGSNLAKMHASCRSWKANILRGYSRLPNRKAAKKSEWGHKGLNKCSIFGPLQFCCYMYLSALRSQQFFIGDARWQFSLPGRLAKYLACWQAGQYP